VRADRVTGILLAALGLLVFWECRGLPLGTIRAPGPAYVPVILGALLILLGGLLALSGAATPHIRDLGWGESRHAAAIVVACAFAAFALERFGYRITMALTVLFLLRAIEKRGAVFALTFALGLALATFYLFETLLRVPLPRGPLGV
jgi:putative tricarboxylic transport membrane protein